MFFHWNPYLKTDSANLLILLSDNDFHKKICRNFCVIFLRNVSSNNICIALGTTQNAENQKTIISTLKNRLNGIWHQVRKLKIPLAKTHSCMKTKASLTDNYSCDGRM